MAMPSLQLVDLQKLKISNKIREDLGKFISEVVDLYEQDLISISVFGSSVSGDYVEDQSDVNLLVVYSELDIDDLQKVSALAQRWFKKRKFSPRFLSKRNLVDTFKYFQIDWMEISDTSVLLYGENVLSQLPASLPDMKWQLSHETKRMRMRIKQQFWKASGNEKAMNKILAQRVSSIIHLMRVYLFLKTRKSPPIATQEILDLAAKHLDFDKAFVETVFSTKRKNKYLKREELVSGFQKILDLIRVVDQAADNLTVS